MNDLKVRVNETDLPVKAWQGQRVVTLKEIDAVHNRPAGTARRNFNTNKEHFIEGMDFHKISADEFRTRFQPDHSRQATEDVTLITESGYLMLVKSFADDLAWEVQRQLVKSYFRGREDTKPMTAMETLRLQSQALLEMDTRMSSLEDKVDKQMTIDSGQQRQLQKVVARRAYERAGMVYKPANLKDNVRAYFDAIYKDLKNRFGVPSYRDIRPADYPAAVAYVESWIEPAELRRLGA